MARPLVWLVTAWLAAGDFGYLLDLTGRSTSEPSACVMRIFFAERSYLEET